MNGINFDMMGADGMNFELGSTTGLIAVVTPDGGTRLVADTLAFPNGMAITPDGRTLLVAESFASRVAAFDVDDDFSLSNRRVWAEIEGGADGVSLDAEGALWCAAQGGASLLAQGGHVRQHIELDRPAFSVALGGPHGTTLFMVANEWNGPENIGKGPRTGVVYMTEVAVPAASRLRRAIDPGDGDRPSRGVSRSAISPCLAPGPSGDRLVLETVAPFLHEDGEEAGIIEIHGGGSSCRFGIRDGHHLDDEQRGSTAHPWRPPISTTDAWYRRHGHELTPDGAD